jgi:hypothetical protein
MNSSRLQRRVAIDPRHIIPGTGGVTIYADFCVNIFRIPDPVKNEVKNMTILLRSILVATLMLAGCTFWGIEEEKTFTAQHVSRENVFSFASVTVEVNPDLKYQNISGDVKIEIFGKLSTPTRRAFHIFTRPGLNKVVFIETHTRNYPHTFEVPQDLTKNMSTIQKGKKTIDGKIWYVFVRAHPEYPEQILSAVRQQGIRIESYGCGLEIGVARVIDRFNRIYISYLKGINECRGLPQNNSLISDRQLKMIRELASQFDENISISDQ